MLREAIEYFRDICVTSGSVKHVRATESESLLYVPGHGITREDNDVPKFFHTVLTLQSFVELAEHVNEGESAVIYVEKEQVRYDLCSQPGKFGNGSVYFELDQNPLFADLVRREMDVKAAVRFARHNLASANVTPDLLESLSKLKFTSGTTADYESRTNAKDSMGKSVLSEVSGERDIPEVITVEFDPFVNLAWQLGDDGSIVVDRVNVDCMVFVEPDTHRIIITAIPGEIDKAWNLALHSLKERLELMLTEDIPVFC